MLESCSWFGKEVADYQIRLRPVTLVKSSLEYASRGLDGAMRHPFLAEPVVERLHEAARILKELVGDRNIELLIWDAYRTPETQAHIFNNYFGDVKAKYPGLSPQETREKAREFVNPPDIIFPMALVAQ